MPAVSPHRSHCTSGFTLIELLTVITVLGILTSLAGISLYSAVQKAQGRQCGSSLLLLENAKDSYLIDHPGTDIPNNAALIPYLKSQKILAFLSDPTNPDKAVCPSGGTYAHLLDRLQKCTCNLNGLNGDSLADGLHDSGN